jgi:hypothetical protein
MYQWHTFEARSTNTWTKGTMRLTIEGTSLEQGDRNESV